MYKSKGTSFVDLLVFIIIIFIFATPSVMELFYEVRCEFGSERACKIIEPDDKQLDINQPEIVVEKSKKSREVIYNGE